MPGLQLPDWPTCCCSLLPVMIIPLTPTPDSYHLFTFADRWCLAAQKVPCTIIPQCNYQCKICGFIRGGLVFTAFTSAGENAHLWLPFTSGRTSPPCLAERDPHPTLQIPPSPLLPSSYLHIPYTTLQVSSALQTLLFSFLSLQLARVYVIQNLGQAADGYNVQSVEVRSCREFKAGFDLHKLVQTPARCAFT